jgi:integrase/recombinase XerD
MKLSEGVENYLVSKRTSGYVFQRGESCLVGFFRKVGDLQLTQVTAHEILTFLDGQGTSTITWRLKYYVLMRFFDFWCARGAMPVLLMPPLRPKVRQTFVPHIYSRAELRALIKATTRTQRPRRGVDRQTLRTLILLLYGTGALVGEVVNLRHEDVNLKEGLITIRSASPTRSRQIPIGDDMRDVLQKYLTWRSRRNFQNDRLLVTKRDFRIPESTAAKNWRRLRESAGMTANGVIYQPRMNDLKYTFAVHRITSWIRNGADLNRMLPALAAYMGQMGLGATERYLQMTPERFCKELSKLSPARRRGHWRDNKDLMTYLANL